MMIYAQRVGSSWSANVIYLIVFSITLVYYIHIASGQPDNGKQSNSFRMAQKGMFPFNNIGSINSIFSKFGRAIPDEYEQPEDLIPDEWFKKNIVQKSHALKFNHTCGKAPRNPLTSRDNQTAYMMGGRNQIYGEWPMFARIKVRYFAVDKATRVLARSVGKCSGAIISERHILTAAHCVHNPITKEQLRMDAFDVFLGDNQVNVTDEHEQTFNVESYCFSKNFYDPPIDEPGNTRHDMAILTLDKKIEFNDYVQPVCLPYQVFETNDQTKCFVVGVGINLWKKDGSSEPVGVFAKQVQTMPVKRAVCKSWRLRENDRSRFCWTKRGNNGDTCAGDSGGPVLCLRRKRWYVLGLVSFGTEFCIGEDEHGFIAVYTRVRGLLEEMNSECDAIV